MKKKLLPLFAFTILSVSAVFGQVTNLLVDNQSANFTMTSGDTLGWSYDVPNPGDTTLVEVWDDKDSSGTINSGDLLWTYFNQIDGNTQGHNGPPDMDGKADGHVAFEQPVGLIPGHYIMYFKNNNVAKKVAGSVTALASPVFTISGNVSSGGNGVKNAIVNMEAINGNKFWTGITDSSGNYTIEMDADTSGNPWILRIDNSLHFRPAIVDSGNNKITLNKSIATDYPNNDFTITPASATINGTLTGDDGKPIINGEVWVNSSTGTFNREVLTDTAGVFKIGLKSNELPDTTLFLNAGGLQDTNVVDAQYTFRDVKMGDSLAHNLELFNTDSTISGRITVDGNSPGISFTIYAQNADTGFCRTQTNASGYYSVKVSSKIYNYTIALGDKAMGYTYTNPVVHAGASNIDINLVSTAIKQMNSVIPTAYSLSQNYPNPFNPSTQIIYQLKSAQDVHLTVYDITGRRVAILVDHKQSAGKHAVTFNANNLSSGIYFYRLRAGSFSKTRKMILLK